MSEKLPQGWVKTTLDEIRLDESMGISQEQMRGETFELYSVPAFREGKPEIVLGDAIGSNKILVSPGDVLLCKINPRINRAWVVSESHGHRQIASTEWIVFSKQEGISSDFLRYFFSQDTFRDYLAANVSGVGGSLMRVRPSVVGTYPFTLPPIAEQNRIVVKLNAALSGVERAEKAARRAQERLQRYRVAVLHAAATGELTRDRREAQRKKESGKSETGDALLHRLLAVRRSRWEEAELQRLRAVGKERKDDKWKSRYREPTHPKTDDLPKLPEGWAWVSIDQLSWATGYGTSVKCMYEADGPAVLRIPNIRNRALNFDDLKFATSFQFASYLIRFRLVGDETIWSWVSLAWDSDMLRSSIESRAATTAGQYNISLSGLADLAIPLPPTNEQTEIVREVERRLVAANQLTSSLDRQLDRAKVTRLSLLREAFEGRLVPRDPKDEPASVLLERIRAAREAEAQKPKGRRMSKSKSKSKAARRPLLDVLREHKKPMTPEQLFMDSGYQQEFEDNECRQEVVDSFYDELRQLVGPKGPVLEKRPNRNTVLLEVKL